MAAARKKNVTEPVQDATEPVENTTDADRLQAAADAIAALWTELQAEMARVSDQAVDKKRELERLLAERDELRDQLPELERAVEMLPGAAYRANLEGDTAAENERRREFNEASGALHWINERQLEIDSELRALGYRTTDPDESRAAREAAVSIKSERERLREDAIFTVEYQAETLAGLVKSRADQALLRDSAAAAANAERARKEVVAAAREREAATVYKARTDKTLQHAEMMPQDRELAEDQPAEMPGYTYGP